MIGESKAKLPTRKSHKKECYLWEIRPLVYLHMYEFDTILEMGVFERD